MKEAARERMLKALPHMRFAVKEAAEQGEVHLGILAMKPDRSGKITATFQATEFFEDLALLIDAPPQTKEDDMDAAAARLVQQIRGG